MGLKTVSVNQFKNHVPTYTTMIIIVLTYSWTISHNYSVHFTTIYFANRDCKYMVAAGTKVTVNYMEAKL